VRTGKREEKKKKKKKKRNERKIKEGKDSKRK
jgi:hypothetical protein